MHHQPRQTPETVRLALERNELVELIDAIVVAVDTDRVDEVRRIGTALERFDLAETFGHELRLSGLPSATWQRCQFCSAVIDEHENSKEAA